MTIRGSASRENFIGLMLTVMLRPYIEGNIPMYLIYSAMPRTGKTKLAGDVLGGIFIGFPTPALQLAGSEETKDKRIISILLSARPIVHIDNVREYLDSAHLASLLTASEYMGRILGTNRSTSIPNNLIFVASGNTIRTTEEISKRCVPIGLTSNVENPETRSDFKHPDLTAHIRLMRPKVFGALARMIPSWHQLGCPPAGGPKGGFERWAQVIGGVMLVNGYGHWRRNESEGMSGSDPHMEDLRSFVREWEEELGEDRVSARDLFKIGEASDDCPHLMKSRTETGHLVSFSRVVLSRHLDAMIAGFYLRRMGTGSNPFYCLEKV